MCAIHNWFKIGVEREKWKEIYNIDNDDIFQVLEMTDVLGNKLSLKLSRKEPANYDDSDNESDQVMNY